MRIKRYQTIKMLRQIDLLSEVFLAFDPSNEKEVAIKVLKSDCRHDDEAVELFFREAMRYLVHLSLLILSRFSILKRLMTLHLW